MVRNTLLHLCSFRLNPDASAPATYWRNLIPAQNRKTVSLSCPAPMRSFSLSDGYSERIIYRQREDRFPHDTYSPPVHRSRRKRNGCQEPVSSYGQRKTEFSKFSLTDPFLQWSNFMLKEWIFKYLHCYILLVFNVFAMESRFEWFCINLMIISSFNFNFV